MRRQRGRRLARRRRCNGGAVHALRDVHGCDSKGSAQPEHAPVGRTRKRGMQLGRKGRHRCIADVGRRRCADDSRAVRWARGAGRLLQALDDRRAKLLGAAGGENHERGKGGPRSGMCGSVRHRRRRRRNRAAQYGTDIGHGQHVSGASAVTLDGQPVDTRMRAQVEDGRRVQRARRRGGTPLCCRCCRATPHARVQVAHLRAQRAVQRGKGECARLDTHISLGGRRRKLGRRRRRDEVLHARARGGGRGRVRMMRAPTASTQARAVQARKQGLLGVLDKRV